MDRPDSPELVDSDNEGTEVRLTIPCPFTATAKAVLDTLDDLRALVPEASTELHDDARHVVAAQPLRRADVVGEAVVEELPSGQ